MNTLAKECNFYLQSMYPSGVSERQAEESRQAFMAGAATVMKRMVSIADMTDDQAEIILILTDHEIQTYVTDRLAKLENKIQKDKSQPPG